MEQDNTHGRDRHSFEDSNDNVKQCEWDLDKVN